MQSKLPAPKAKRLQIKENFKTFWKNIYIQSC